MLATIASTLLTIACLALLGVGAQATLGGAVLAIVPPADWDPRLPSPRATFLLASILGLLLFIIAAMALLALAASA